MGQVVLLVVGAAWAAVLLPPLLRSRGQNRPNSSVSDFRDQLTSLQKVSKGVHMRTMGRSLVAGQVERTAARSLITGSHRSITLHPTTGKSVTGAHAIVPPRTPERARGRDGNEAAARRGHDVMRGERSHRQLAVRRDGADAVKRRRANVLFVLALAAVTTLVLALTTKSTALLYVFGGVFVTLAGYVYLLGRARQRDVHELVDVTPSTYSEPDRRPERRAEYDGDRRPVPRRSGGPAATDRSRRQFPSAQPARRRTDDEYGAARERRPVRRQRPMQRAHFDLA